jgi:hypothetical protein
MPELRERLPFHAQRIALSKFAQAIKASPTALVRDGSGDPVIDGENGTARALPAGYELFLACETETALGDAKRALSFALLVKSNRDSALFWLRRLPSPAEAETVRQVLGVPKRFEPSPRPERAASVRLPGGDMLMS